MLKSTIKKRTCDEIRMASSDSTKAYNIKGKKRKSKTRYAVWDKFLIETESLNADIILLKVDSLTILSFQRRNLTSR